ncbi:MAG TPA: DUF1206 domain-containing protein [Gemmatimonadales bacterium]|nr:DUF1206 domain-containing protein [Gemmatimonadales bacterium]
MASTELDRAVGGVAPLIDRFARFGFAMKGIVTVLIGALALRYALGWGGDVTGPSGALEALLLESFGTVVLGILAVGLAAYALWMFVEAILDPEQKGTGLQGLAERIAFFVTGVGYTFLARAAFNLLFARSVTGGTTLEDLAAAVLTPHIGRWAVGLVGAAVMIAGLLQLRLGISAGFRSTLDPVGSPAWRVAIFLTGIFGYVALGVLSLMVGYSLVQVAVQYEPSEAGGWEEALWLLLGLVEGRWLLGIVAAGLICYGFYFVLLMRFRRL